MGRAVKAQRLAEMLSQPQGGWLRCVHGSYVRRVLEAHLHHQHDGVESDHGHDGVLKGWGHHELPHSILEALLVLGHVPGQRLGTDGKIDAGPLWEMPAHERGQQQGGQLLTASWCSCPDPSSWAQLGSLQSLRAPHKT